MPPGANGTIILIGRSGYDWANADVAIGSVSSSDSAARRSSHTREADDADGFITTVSTPSTADRKTQRSCLRDELGHRVGFEALDAALAAVARFLDAAERR